jgi:hypothetical protein
VEPVDVVVVGTALNTQGLVAYNTIEGLGLNTLGFLWPCAGIWDTAEASVSTTWVTVPGYESTTEVCVD